MKPSCGSKASGSCATRWPRKPETGRGRDSCGQIEVTPALEETTLLNPAVLALEDGTVFEGQSFGAPVERSGEVVFNTAITGYQEIFTDPSYSGQIVVLTNPQIGNYGANDADNESVRPFIEGLVVREFSPLSSNRRAEETAQQFLTGSGVPVITGIDTRALVRHLRSRGVMRRILSANPYGEKI